VPGELASGDAPRYDVRTLDYGRAPFLVIWEVSRACDLACVHCRASAIPFRDPEELTLGEATRLFGQIREMGTRLLVLTGGDPLKRPDIHDLIEAAARAELQPSLSPSVTPLLTAGALARARAAGLSSVSLSLDGAGAATHDTFRGVAGSFDRTLEMANVVRAAGLELRLNTTVTARNLDEMEDLARLVASSGARTWSVFFLVPTGRAEAALQITADQCERTLQWLYRLSMDAPFRIKTTEAPHYRRVVLEALAAESGRPVEAILRGSKSGRGRFVPGMNDARGFAFISHRGEMFPSGFFPLAAGNVRQVSVVSLYRHSPLFKDLRDPARLKGRCGACPFGSVCGGSRARAFAVSGDPLGEDPLCGYQPAGPAGERMTRVMADAEAPSYDEPHGTPVPGGRR
jgi:AdoMet-dependent heme synthase